MDPRQIGHENAPQPELINKRTRKTMTSAQGLTNNGWTQALEGRLHGDALQLLALGQEVSTTGLSQEPDTHIWRWTASGTYSAISSYMASFLVSLHGRHGRLSVTSFFSGMPTLTDAGPP
jgi:hypothetical protein